LIEYKAKKEREKDFGRPAGRRDVEIFQEWMEDMLLRVRESEEALQDKQCVLAFSLQGKELIVN